MNRTRAADALDLRAAMLREIFGSVLDDARKFLLVNVVETYLKSRSHAVAT